MTISTPLSSARSHSFQSTMAAQHKRSGQVQFSLPPVKDSTGPAGSSTPAAGSISQLAASGAAALSLINLPIATPIAAAGGLALAALQPPAGAATVTPARPGPGVTLPIATPVGALGGLGTTTTPPPAGSTTVTPARPGLGVTLPIATPVGALGGLGTATAAGTALNHGNVLSAPLITRLYQRQG
jgi:hypothetical protein